MNLEMMSDRREHPLEAIKIGHQELSQDSIYTLNLFLESWRIWRFLMNLELVSDDRDHPSEASVKVSSRSNIRDPVKTPFIIQSLPGVLEDMEVPDEPGGGVR